MDNLFTLSPTTTFWPQYNVIIVLTRTRAFRGEEVSISLVYNLGLWTDQTPLICASKRNMAGKKLHQVGSRDGKLGENKHKGSKKYHVETNEIWRDEAMKTLKKLAAGTRKMGHCRS